MKTTFKTISLAVLIILGLNETKLIAQENLIENKTTFSIETDPSTFLFKGYAIHIRIKPKNYEHLLLGAGTYALDLPGFLVNLNKVNKEKEWNVRINNAVSLFGEYYFKDANQKWFVGLQIGIQNYKITNDHIENLESKYSNLLTMPSIGYNWQPFKNRFYIKPWLGIGYTTKITGNNSINTMTYNISPLTNFVTIHVGYTFR
jgi:hypothetical protein